MKMSIVGHCPVADHQKEFAVGIFKLVITGAFNTGKSTFIRSLSDITTVDTDKATSTPDEQKIKANTTVAMDYGRVKLDDQVIQLFGTPGQARFSFMREILAKDMDGLLMLVDLSNPATIDEAANVLVEYQKDPPIPYAIVANKSDLNSVMKQHELREQLSIPKDIHIYLCNATDQKSVREVVRRFLRDLSKN